MYGSPDDQEELMTKDQDKDSTGQQQRSAKCALLLLAKDGHELLAIGEVGIVMKKQQGMVEEHVIKVASVVEKEQGKVEEHKHRLHIGGGKEECKSKKAMEVKRQLSRLEELMANEGFQLLGMKDLSVTDIINKMENEAGGKQEQGVRGSPNIMDKFLVGVRGEKDEYVTEEQGPGQAGAGNTRQRSYGGA